MLKFIGWLLSVMFAFSLGAGTADPDRVPETELERKVRDHMDVIVDESAAMVDDVVDEFRQNEYVQDAEAFADDVNEIIDNTREDIKTHFGKDEEEAVEEGELSEAEETDEAEAAEEEVEAAEAEEQE